MNKCYICQKENTIQYICPICNKNFCEAHIYSHSCYVNSNKSTFFDFIQHDFSVSNTLFSIFYYLKNQLSMIYLFILYFCIISYLLSFIFKNLIFNFCFIPNISTLVFEPWRIFTYMFVHESFFHLFFNLIALNLFGSILEPQIGKKKFLYSYLFCGIISALFHFIFSSGSLIGSSGCILGLLSICSLKNPDITIFINFIPIKLKYSIIFLFIFDLFSGLFLLDHIAHFAHIGGLLSGLMVGYLFINE